MAKNTQIIEVKTKGAKQAKQQLNGVSGGLKSMAKSAGIAAAAYFGAKKLLSGLKSSIDLYKEQELAEVKLRQALGKSIIGLQNYASGLQQITNFGDEVIMQGMAQLAFFIKDEEQLKVATKATLDLASAKGMDLVTAADLVAKSVGSSTNALSRYGIAAEGAVGSEGRLLSITDEIANLFGGQAEATTKSLSGAMDQLNNAVGDTQEAIGSILAPVVQNLTGFFTSAAQSASDFFLSITETDLETVIRRLREAGISAEALAGLEIINLQNSLSEVNKEIDKQNLKYKTSEDAQKALAEIGNKTVGIGEGINEGITKREMLLGRLRGMIKAQSDGIVDQAGKVSVLNEVTGTTRDIHLMDLETMIATTQATLGYGTSLHGLQEELDGVVLKTDQITDNAERQLEKSTMQGEAIAAEIEILEEKERIEARIAELKGEGVETETDPIETQSAFNIALNEYIELQEEKTKADIESIKLEDAYILKMREKGKMMDVLTSKEKQEQEAQKQRVDKTLQGIAMLSSSTKASAIADAISATYSGANEEYRKYVKQYPAPLGTILGIAAAGATIGRGLQNVKEIKKAQYGADFITDSPQLMMVGEGSGPERVQVTPLADPNIDGPQGQGITLNISGNVLHESFIEDSVIPQIREGLRLGENIGL